MAESKRAYSIYDDKGTIVMSFIGNNDMIERGIKFGRLTSNTNNEMMLIVTHGMEVSNWNFALGFKAYMRAGWSLVKHNQ